MGGTVIYFGKPYANVYIDDLALNCFDDIEKELGLHLEEVQPRHFNQLKEIVSFHIINK